MRRKTIQYEKDQNGCLICTSHASSQTGYPHISINGKSCNLCRVLYEWGYGPIPQGLVVRHKCDNRKCINLDHLELGTQKDNVADMFKRGRAKRTSKISKKETNQIQKIYSTKNFSQNEIANIFNLSQQTVSLIIRSSSAYIPHVNNGRKLTVDKVLEIRNLYKESNLDFQELAKIFEVSKRTIYDIVNLRSWKHL